MKDFFEQNNIEKKLAATKISISKQPFFLIRLVLMRYSFR